MTSYPATSGNRLVILALVYAAVLSTVNTLVLVALIAYIAGGL